MVTIAFPIWRCGSRTRAISGTPDGLKRHYSLADDNGHIPPNVRGLSATTEYENLPCWTDRKRRKELWTIDTDNMTGNFGCKKDNSGHVSIYLKTSSLTIGQVFDGLLELPWEKFQNPAVSDETPQQAASSTASHAPGATAHVPGSTSHMLAGGDKKPTAPHEKEKRSPRPTGGMREKMLTTIAERRLGLRPEY
ncbi:hypothetical protein J132_10817 [Termitomyces sp. J132]|nr:hypothetical protein J132_10817 [Termitomyces sp. J132]